MRVCFVGLGSIATRHIKNLKELYQDGIIIDLLRSSCNNGREWEIDGMVNKIYYDLSNLPKNYDAIFITNPTGMHYETLKACHEYGRNFFIEKPVFETGRENIDQLSLKEEKQYYVACPLRYTNVIQYLKKNINFADIYSIRCISSSYLPEWRPGIDYRKTYSARKELGGGVATDLIHEWDYICYLFGKPDKVLNLFGKKSHLEINSEDIAIYIAEYKERLVELHLDYFGKVPIRKIELFCKQDTVEADLIEQKIVFKSENKVIDFKESRDSYQQKELIHFFDIVNGKCQSDNSIEEACMTLRIARGD